MGLGNAVLHQWQVYRHLNKWNRINSQVNRKLVIFSGTASFTFFCFWIFLVKNDPANDTQMSNEEREYIKEKLNNTDHTEKV